MNRMPISFVFDAQGQRLAISESGAVATTIPELLAAMPRLAAPENVSGYAEAVNHLGRGDQYRPIHDPEAFRAQYTQRLQAEDHAAPFRDGAPQLSSFGACDLAEIQRPRVEQGMLIFYVEHAYLGLPFRVTAPAPGEPEGEVCYEPLPMTPLVGLA